MTTCEGTSPCSSRAEHRTQAAARVFNAEQLLGTPQSKMVKELVPGGHIGLFMGRKTLEDTWPEICEWILSYDTF